MGFQHKWKSWETAHGHVPTLFTIESLHDCWHTLSYVLSYKESMLAVKVMWLSVTVLVSTSQSIQDMWCNSYLNSRGHVSPNQLQNISKGASIFSVFQQYVSCSDSMGGVMSIVWASLLLWVWATCFEIKYYCKADTFPQQCIMISTSLSYKHYNTKLT